MGPVSLALNAIAHCVWDSWFGNAAISDLILQCLGNSSVNPAAKVPMMGVLWRNWLAKINFFTCASLRMSFVLQILGIVHSLENSKWRFQALLL